MPNTETQNSISQKPVVSAVDVNSTYVAPKNLSENTASIVEPSLLDTTHVLSGIIEATEYASSGTNAFENPINDLAPLGGEDPTPPPVQTTASMFAVSGNPVSICMQYMFEVLKNNIIANRLMNKQAAESVTSANEMAISSYDSTITQANRQYSSEMTESQLQFVNMGIGIGTTVAPAVSNNRGEYKTNEELQGRTEPADRSTLGAHYERAKNSLFGSNNPSANSRMGAAEHESLGYESRLNTVHDIDARRETVPPATTHRGTAVAADGAVIGGPAPTGTAPIAGRSPDQEALITTGKLDPNEHPLHPTEFEPGSTTQKRALTEKERVEEAYAGMDDLDRSACKHKLREEKKAADNLVNTYQSRVSGSQTFWRAMHDILTSGFAGGFKAAEAEFNKEATEARAESEIYSSIQNNQSRLVDTNKSLAGKYFDEGVAALQQISKAGQSYNLRG